MADIPPPPPPSAPPPPLPSGYASPPPYQPPPLQPGMAPPPGSPGYMPQPITPTAGGINLGAQIMGAGWSIAVGAAGIVLPIASAFILGGTVYYFYVLPIFGVIYGARAIMRGFVIGGIAGIVLNVIAGLISLTASGFINPGGQ